jgi:hypothetical protein
VSHGESRKPGWKPVKMDIYDFLNGRMLGDIVPLEIKENASVLY